MENLFLFPKDFKLCCLDTFAKSIIPLLMINTRAEVSRGKVLGAFRL